MKQEDYERILDLVQQRNQLQKKCEDLQFSSKNQNCYIFSEIEGALYKDENKREINSYAETIWIKHKEELYKIVQKICKKEELELSKQIDEIDRKLDSINIDFGEDNAETKSDLEN